MKAALSYREREEMFDELVRTQSGISGRFVLRATDGTNRYQYSFGDGTSYDGTSRVLDARQWEQHHREWKAYMSFSDAWRLQTREGYLAWDLVEVRLDEDRSYLRTYGSDGKWVGITHYSEFSG